MAHRRELLLEFAALFAEAADFHGTVEAFDALLAREELADLVAPGRPRRRRAHGPRPRPHRPHPR